MNLSPRLVQTLKQKLLLTPQLRQAIELLNLNQLELNALIQDELLNNPFLVEVENENDLTQTSIAASEENSHLKPPEEYFEISQPSASYSAGSNQSMPELPAKSTESLLEFLMTQLRRMELSERELDIIAKIVGNLDERGYLTVSREDLCRLCSASDEEVERAMKYVRSLEPIGVGARDLKECLLIQLEDLGLEISLAGKIVRDHLELLANYRYDQISKLEGVSAEELTTAIAIIRSLKPHPGDLFSDEAAITIRPDVALHKTPEGWIVIGNDEVLPKIRLADEYLKSALPEIDSSADKKFLNERFKSANWLLRSIAQRNQTIKKVAEAIIRCQNEFLDGGPDKLKPLTLKDIASLTGLHESTISRATHGKYIETPYGTFELKYFFTKKIQAANGEISAEVVKDKIKTMIQLESSDKPLSDQEISKVLQNEGIRIARRTIAKYREELNIPGVHTRKRAKSF
ncbi:MAG TPA: RNA polymerase factor sigma-54 [Oligoflexia bacterium]|nr:RNA polymerase factor sigma-54 [Oligoflexia bacterium]HMP26372.1 RNA polymerase factor sigma-54 [Oligoflexia bacterium]